jgi:hypothetical protein
MIAKTAGHNSYNCNTQELIRQMHRVTGTAAGVVKLQQKMDSAQGSWIWDFEQALIKERFHLRVERTTLRFMRSGADHRAAYLRALRYHNLSIHGK